MTTRQVALSGWVSHWNSTTISVTPWGTSTWKALGSMVSRSQSMRAPPPVTVTPEISWIGPVAAWLPGRNLG